MTVGEGVNFLRDTMAVLRGEDGCEWDRAQDHASLVPFLIEETAELVDAIDSGVRADIVEELGDVLYQVLFHADILATAGDGAVTIDDIARATAEKMRRRHPHVFGDVDVSGVDEIRANWLAQKKAEKGAERSIVDQVPKTLNSLARAQALIHRADRESIDVAACDGCGAVDTDVGAAVLAVVREANTRDIDADTALRHTIRHLESHLVEEENKRRGDSSNG